MLWRKIVTDFICKFEFEFEMVKLNWISLGFFNGFF